MFARWIATVAALLLACANPQASAHVRAERMADLVDRTDHSATALPGELASKSKTAPPARARLADLTPGEKAALSHCHVWQKSLSESNRTSGVAVYTWDAEGRLTGAVLGNGPTQKTTSYRYDPNGIRRSQQVTEAGGAVSRKEYLVDPNQAYAQVLEEWGATAASGPLPDETLATTYVYGDDLISQTKLALAGAATTSVYHYDGLGTTRALSAYKVDAAGVPEAGHGEITDRYAYTAFGESDPAGTSGDTSGSSENNYRYTGEQLDPNLGFYYLRARYMDPGQGRFVGMDTWKGDLRDPITQNMFVYANANPSMFFDPSGHMGLLELLESINIQSMGRTISTQTLRRYVRRVISQTIRDVGSVRREVRKCLNSRRSCDLDVPVLIVGGTHAQMADHIYDAQLAQGHNILPSGFLHSFNNRTHTQWYIGQDGCRASDLTAAVAQYGPLVECDEFPMNSMDLGGSSNHPSFVSLRYVPLTQNRSIGGMWLQLVNASGMRADPKKKALVVAWREIAISVWLPVR